LTFFHCILLAKSLAHKKIEILCLLGVKDIMNHLLYMSEH
jgi:hypothetical protein